MVLNYGWSDFPTHDPNPNCAWIKRSFVRSGITALVQDCPNSKLGVVISEDPDGTIIETVKVAPSYKFTMQILAKDKASDPLDVVKGWYAKLTSEQQKICEIQNADRPLQYFFDGRLMQTEEPHPTSHKTRYKIDISRKIVKEIFDKYDGDPGGGSERDYACGNLVGTSWSDYPPYFEFDDRSQEKYLFVGSYGQGGQPDIDLNSMRF